LIICYDSYLKGYETDVNRIMVARLLVLARGDNLAMMTVISEYDN